MSDTNTVGLKETLEIFDALELLAQKIGEALADDKIDLSDLPTLLDLVNEYKVFSEAVKDIKLVVDEVKDLDQAELIQLGTRAYALAQDIKNIF